MRLWCCCKNHNQVSELPPSSETSLGKRSHIRNLALLDLGLRSISSALGRIGFRLTSLIIGCFSQTQIGKPGGQEHSKPLNFLKRFW